MCFLDNKYCRGDAADSDWVALEFDNGLHKVRALYSCQCDSNPHRALAFDVNAVHAIYAVETDQQCFTDSPSFIA